MSEWPARIFDVSMDGTKAFSALPPPRDRNADQPGHTSPTAASALRGIGLAITERLVADGGRATY